MSGVSTPSRRLSRIDDRDRPAQPAKRLLVQLGPAPGARREGQQADALAAIAQGEDEQPGPAVLARVGMPHHRAVAVVDLAFFPGGRHDHGVRLGGPLAPQRDDEAADAGVLGGEAVIVDEIAPDRHGVAAAAQGRLDQLAIRLAGAGGGRAPRRGRRAQRAGRSLADGRPSRWTPLWPVLPRGGPTAPGPARRARRP